VESTHNVLVSVNEEFLLSFEHNFASTILWQQYSVTNFHSHCSELTIVKNFARSNCDDLAEIKLIVFLS
jgi:hypothetical protein